MLIKKSEHIRHMFTAFSFSLLLFCFYGKDLRAQEIPLYLKNPNYKIQTGIYELSGNQQAAVVMLGNSLTYNANWNELLNRKNIANRGIVSDITEGYLYRLGYVYRLKPELCFIEGGVNDIYENIPVEHIFKNYINIIDTLKSHKIIPVIQSTLFVSQKWHNAAEKNKEIEKLNRLLKKYAGKNSVEYLNINLLLSANGFLRDELTYDGVHLNAKGYTLWAFEVEKVLIKHGI